MRVLVIFIFACSLFANSAKAGEELTDEKVSALARPERSQLAKFFLDMLAIIERHRLREKLIYFLEAGCALEMSNYHHALAQQLPSEWREQEVRGHLLSTQLIGSMEENAERFYREQPVSFCSGDACVLDAYRKCLLLQIPDEVTKRTEPRQFEQSAQQKCKGSESSALSVLTIDFTNAQKLQLDPGLSEKTRDLIDQVITDVRHTIVISYAEELRKVEPGRLSCGPQLCGDRPCISLDPEPEPEYKCAIGERSPPRR